MICENCKANFSCGCKIRTASNGKKCCVYCIDAVEKEIKKKEKEIKR